MPAMPVHGTPQQSSRVAKPPALAVGTHSDTPAISLVLAAPFMRRLIIHPSGGSSAVRLKKKNQEYLLLPEARKGLELNPQPLWVPPVCLCARKAGTTAAPEPFKASMWERAGKISESLSSFMALLTLIKLKHKGQGLAQKLQVNLTGILSFFTSDWSCSCSTITFLTETFQVLFKYELIMMNHR